MKCPPWRSWRLVSACFFYRPLMSRLAENLVYCGKEPVSSRALAEMKKNFESRNRPAY
jgi:hypothetical protein